MRSQKLGHVHEVVHAECGVALLCPDAWRSIEGYMRPYARDCCASVLSVCARDTASTASDDSSCSRALHA